MSASRNGPRTDRYPTDQTSTGAIRLMSRSPLLPALAATLVLVLGACAESNPSSETPDATASQAPSSAPPSEEPAPSDVPAQEATVRLSRFAFDTEELTIAAGTEVTFVNADSAAHTVTEGTDGAAADDPIIDEELQQNGSAIFTFDEPGSYQITCLFHPSMNMTIIVE